MPDDMNFSTQVMGEILESLNGIDLSNTAQVAEVHTKLQTLYKNAESAMDKMGKEIDKMELQLDRKRTSLTAKVDSALKKNKEQIEKIDSLIREKVQNSMQYKKAYEKVLKSGAISADDPAILEFNRTVQTLTAQLKKENKEYETLLSKGRELMRQKEAEKASKGADPEVTYLQNSISEMRSRKAALERAMEEANKGLRRTSAAYYKVSEQKTREWELKQLKKEQQAEDKRRAESQAREAAKKQKARAPKARTLYTPEEIASGKVAPGQTAYVPMKLMTRGPKGEPIHENVYTGITEEELVKKYHFTPAQAKKMAPKFTAEEYKKFLPKPSFTVSKMAGVPVGAKEFTGYSSAGKKGTAYHTVAEMALEGWSVEDIIKEYRAKHYKQPSRLTDEQFADLSGIKDISKALGGKKDKDQKALKAHLESFANMIKPMVSSQGRSLIEQTLGGVTNVNGKNVAWGGTFDAILGNILLDLKSNQNMSDKMGVQVNVLKYLANLARSAGLDIPEIKGLKIAHQPAATGEGQIPIAQVHRVTEIGDEDMAKYIVEILNQMLEKEAGTRKAYNTEPFEKLKNLTSPFTKTAFTTKDGKTVETWKDTNRGFLKQMLAEADSSEKIAELANYFRTNYAPEELSQVMRTLFAHSDDKGKQDKFTAGSFWEDKEHPENVEILRQRLSSLRKEMLPSASKKGVAGHISEEHFIGDDEQTIDFIKLDGLNIGDWAVTYKTALEEQDEKLANSIVSYLASTIKEYFKDSSDTDSLKLGEKLADKIKDLSSEVTSEASEKVYDSLSQKVGEALGVDYSRKNRIDVDYTNNTTAAQYYTPQIETAIDELGKMSSDDTEVIERRKEEQGMRDTFESMKAFTLADSYDENKLRQDAHNTRKVKWDRLANWLYGMINQSGKVENLLRPYYDKALQEAKVDETQVSFQDFIQKILADNPALYQQYRDSQKLQEMFSSGAGGQFGSLAVTQEQALKGLEAIRQGIGGTSPANLTQEMEAFYGAWENLEDSSDFDSLMLKYAMGEKPAMPEGAQMDLANSLFARMARGEGARYYGKSDRMATDMPEQYAQEINAIQIKEEELVRLANETQDTLDANVRTLQDREEVYEKAIQELAISHFEKGVDIDATRDLLSRPDVQRNYNERREALEEYRNLVGDSKAKLRIDKEGMAYEVSPIDYKEIEENFKGSVLEEQFGSLEKYYAAIDDALEKFAAATGRLVGNSSSPGQIWDTSSEVRKDRLRVLETMRKYDLEAQEDAERQQATIEETKATEYAKIKIDALNRMQGIFAQEAAQRLANNKAYVSPDEEAGSDEDIWTPVGTEEVKASQGELETATIQRAQAEQEAIKVDQQSTQALQDESEALKNKAEIARELISALEDKNKTEKEAIATDEKSTKSTRKRVTASETLKQRLANQKVREQIAESKAKEAAALSKAGRGSGAKKQSAGAKEDYSKYAKNLKEITKAMLEREKIEKELNTTPSMLAKGRESREKLLIEYEGIIGKLTAQNELMIEQGRLSKEQVAQIEAEAQATRKLNSLKVQGQKGGASNIFEVIGSNIKNTITRMFDYTGVYRVLNKLMASVSKIIQLSKELDSTMFNLRVVTGDSREETVGLIGDYRKLADQLGATTVQIANAANEWLRQGYEAQQANELITASTYLSKLGMIESGQATEYLTSMIKGFKLEVSDAIDVVSKLTAVDMEAASSAGDIAAALQNVSTTAQLAGVSLDETIAYATTIIETTQRDASSVGMALRTIMSRYGNVKAGAYTKMNLESSSDTDLENLNDIEKVLGKIGIRIRSTNTEFRSFSDVLEELSDKWINLDNVSKNAIATAMAGVRQREQFLVLMENMERVEELEQVSATSQGTAEQKYAAYMETIESASNRLQSAWENLAMTLEQSGLVKLFTDLSVLFMKALLPAIRAVGAALVQYNAFKVPIWMKEFFSGKGKGLLSGLGSRKFAQYRQDWKASKLKEMQDKSAEEATEAANSKLAQSATSTASALDKVTESASQGATAEAQGTKEESKNTSATSRDTKEIKEHTQAVTQDTNKQKTGDVPGKEGGKIKDYFKASLSNAPGAILGGALSGFTTGVGTEGSTTAKAVSGVVAGGLTAIGGAFAGPIGSVIGSAVGSALGPFFANLIDKEEIDRKERVEAASKLLETLKSQETAVENLVKTSRSGNLLSDDIKSIRDNVQAIKDAGENGDATRDAFINIVNEELKDPANADLLGKLNVGTAQSLYDNLEYILTDESISSELRTRVAEWMERANIRSQRSAFLASKEGKTLTSADEKQLLEYDLREAYKKSGVSNMGSMKLTQMGTAAVEQMIAKIAGKELTTEVRRMIQLMMKQDTESISVQSLLAGGKYTLRDIVDNVYNLSSEVQSDLLDQAARALGMSVDDVIRNIDRFDTLTVGNLNSSLPDLQEAASSSVSRFQELASKGVLSLDSLLEIIKSNSVESTQLGEENNKVIKSINDYYQAIANSAWLEWTGGTASGANIFKNVTQGIFTDKIRKKDDQFLGLLETAGFGKDKTSLDNLEKALRSDVWTQTIKVGEGDDAKNVVLSEHYADEIADLWEQWGTAAANGAKQIGEVVSAKADSTLLESIGGHIDERLKREQEALEEQKSALEQINKQREYENKLIEAKLKLENAQNEKKKVWREGVGWVYEADTSAIADAQKELEELDNEKNINELQTLIDELQAQRDWMTKITDDKAFMKAQEFMKTWEGNNESTLEMLRAWETAVKNPFAFVPADSSGEGLQKRKKSEEQYLADAAAKNIKQAYTDLVETAGGKWLESSTGSLVENQAYLGQMEDSDIEAFNNARANFESIYAQNINQSGLSEYLTEEEKAQYEKLYDKSNTAKGGVGEIVKGMNYLPTNITTDMKIVGGQAHDAATRLSNYLDLHNDDYMVLQKASTEGDDRWNKWWRTSLFYYSDAKKKWLLVSDAKEDPKNTADILNAPGFRNRYLFNGKTQKMYYLNEYGEVYEYTPSSHATGTLSAPGGLSVVNDDPQYGLEGIITPQGTLTALPSKSGVVPADMTRNVWQLGEVAPNLIKQLVDINGKFNSPLGFGTDESFNVDHLDVHMVAQPGFDMDDFVRQLRAARDLSKHS